MGQCNTRRNQVQQLFRGTASNLAMVTGIGTDEGPQDSFWKFSHLSDQNKLLTLSAHAREGYSSHFVSLSVCHFSILEKAPFSGLKLTSIRSR